ncbi:MAG: hypothetical protein GXP14_10610, partial [Gammaproteobacteria bacterium]|nr:hypothetical protein [Gammaproteobacteria bacterium]
MTKEHDTNANDAKDQPTQGDTTENFMDKMVRRKRTFNADSATGETGTTATSRTTMPREQAEQLDKITTKLNQTEAELTTKTDTINHSEANNIVKNHVIAGLTLGLIPLPLLDIAALSSTQL